MASGSKFQRAMRERYDRQVQRIQEGYVQRINDVIADADSIDNRYKGKLNDPQAKLNYVKERRKNAGTLMSLATDMWNEGPAVISHEYASRVHNVAYNNYERWEREYKVAKKNARGSARNRLSGGRGASNAAQV